MLVKFNLLIAGAVLAAGLATATQAQTTADGESGTVVVDGNNPAPGELSMGQEEGEPAVGQTYISAEYGDWQLRCVRAEEGTPDPCQLYQLLRDDNGNSVAEISVFNLPEDNPAAAGATIITPLETLLTQQLSLSVDGGSIKRYPFTFCSQIGCFARVGFTAAEVEMFRRGNEGKLVIVPVGAPNQQVALTISLTGFTAGFEAVHEANAN